MSQSDYLNHKRNAQVLENQSILESVLESQQLTNFKTYSISKQIDNDKIFDMKFDGLENVPYNIRKCLIKKLAQSYFNVISHTQKKEQ